MCVSLTPADCSSQPSYALAAAAAEEEGEKKSKSSIVLSGHRYDAERQQRGGRIKKKEQEVDRGEVKVQVVRCFLPVAPSSPGTRSRFSNE